MRHDEALAIREFYRRFTPALWKLARQAHVQPALRDDVATDCLEQCRHHLMQPTVAVPANLTGYLVAMFRHRLANDRRATTAPYRRREPRQRGSATASASCARSSLSHAAAGSVSDSSLCRATNRWRGNV